MDYLQVHKVLFLPEILVPNAIYLVADQKNKIVQIIITSQDGNDVFRTVNQSDIKAMLHDELASNLFHDSVLKEHLKQQKIMNYYLIALIVLLVSIVITTLLIVAIAYLYLQQSLILDIHYLLSNLESMF